MTYRWALSALAALAAVLVVGCGDDADGQRSEGTQTIASSAAGGVSGSLDVSFRLDETAYTAPPVSWPVPFDVVAADMELDGDPDILVNWHNVARLELFENTGDHFVLRNREGDDRSERWTPSFGQVFVTAKVESGS